MSFNAVTTVESKRRIAKRFNLSLLQINFVFCVENHMEFLAEYRILVWLFLILKSLYSKTLVLFI